MIRLCDFPGQLQDPPSPNSPQNCCGDCWGDCQENSGCRARAGAVPGELLGVDCWEGAVALLVMATAHSPLAAVSSAVFAALPPALPSAPRVSLALSPAVSTAVLGNLGLGPVAGQRRRKSGSPSALRCGVRFVSFAFAAALALTPCSPRRWHWLSQPSVLHQPLTSPSASCLHDSGHVCFIAGTLKERRFALLAPEQERLLPLEH